MLEFAHVKTMRWPRFYVTNSWSEDEEYEEKANMGRQALTKQRTSICCDEQVAL